MTINVAHGDKVRVWARGVEMDLTQPSNDILPFVKDEASGPGDYITELATGADGGEYRVTYNVIDSTGTLPTPGVLVIREPRYGPNGDTGGSVVRVSENTPIQLLASTATGLSYRFWKQDSPKPRIWQTDLDAGFGGLAVDFSSNNDADGFYFIEYAPISNDMLLSPRRHLSVQLDTAAPAILTPGNLTVDATSAAGATVNFEVSATDNLPGPVSISCDVPSGSFFPVNQVTEVTCTATDEVDNVGVSSFGVEVVSPFGVLQDFVVLGQEWARLGPNTQIQSGNIGAFDASAGPPGAAGFEIVAGESASVAATGKVAGQSVRLKDNSIVGDVYYADLLEAGDNAIFEPHTGYVPLFSGMPTTPAFGAGGDNIKASDGDSLSPGSYGKVEVMDSATLTLTGGDYFFDSLRVRENGQLRFAAPSTVHVTGKVRIGAAAVVAPEPGSGMGAQDIVLWVAETDSSPGPPMAFFGGENAQLTLNLYAFNGTVTLGEATQGTGSFLGLRVHVKAESVLNVDSAFESPSP